MRDIVSTLVQSNFALLVAASILLSAGIALRLLGGLFAAFTIRHRALRASKGA